MSLKNRMFGSALVMGIALTTGGQVMAAPQLNVKSEQKAHPNLVKAIKEDEAAIKHLEAAPDDFGGNKAAAIEDTKKAIHSLKKAMYYRLKMDDTAIDAAQ